MKSKCADVKVWGIRVGRISWNYDRKVGEFEFDPDFANQGLDLAPIQMPLKDGGKKFSFPALNSQTYLGLPGMLADALPDRWGNLVIDRLLRVHAVNREDFTPVDLLCYMGRRSMGALEFEPLLPETYDVSETLSVNALVEGARGVLDAKDLRNQRGLNAILRAGSSAGGARAKAVIAINPATGEMKSGQADAGEGFEYWLIKLDGLTNKQLGDPKAYGRIEFAYYLMTKEAGIVMSESKLLQEEGRAHFMTLRFDRDASNQKLHMQSLCAMAHYDYNSPAVYSYEQAFQVIDTLRLAYRQKEQLYLRALFNVMTRNHDDHTKNISFLMDRNGTWSLSPAYDLTYSYQAGNRWLNCHQMMINGKTDSFTRSDLIALAENNRINNAPDLIEQVSAATAKWRTFADAAELAKSSAIEIQKQFRKL